jgi:hypothetical protein
MRPATGPRPSQKPKGNSKGILIAIVVAVLLIVVLAFALKGGQSGAPTTPTATEAKLASLPAGSIVASSRKGVYHLPSCELAKEIPVEDLQVFASVQEAEDAMCHPCSKCISK